MEKLVSRVWIPYGIRRSCKAAAPCPNLFVYVTVKKYDLIKYGRCQICTNTDGNGRPARLICFL
jgi:hypothetical protein